MTDLPDANARSRIQTEFGTTFFVEAAAGAGKTTALVGRIVGLIRSGRGTLARTVAVTFTEKAAGEMKLRLRLEIERARADATPEERTRLDRALEELELPASARSTPSAAIFSASGPSRLASIRSSRCSMTRRRRRWLTRRSSAGCSASSRILPRVRGASCGGDQASILRRSSCGLRFRLSANIAIFRVPGGAIRSTAMVRSTP
jgi:hypothetical protein